MTFGIDWTVQPHETTPGTVGTVSVSGIIFTGKEENHPHGDWKAISNGIAGYPIELDAILPPDTTILNAWYDLQSGFRDLNNMKVMRVLDGGARRLYVSVQSLNQDIDTELGIVIHVLFRGNDAPPSIPAE